MGLQEVKTTRYQTLSAPYTFQKKIYPIRNDMSNVFLIFFIYFFFNKITGSEIETNFFLLVGYVLPKSETTVARILFKINEIYWNSVANSLVTQSSRMGFFRTTVTQSPPQPMMRHIDAMFKVVMGYV